MMFPQLSLTVITSTFSSSFRLTHRLKPALSWRLQWSIVRPCMIPQHLQTHWGCQMYRQSALPQQKLQPEACTCQLALMAAAEAPKSWSPELMSSIDLSAITIWLINTSDKWAIIAFCVFRPWSFQGNEQKSCEAPWATFATDISGGEEDEEKLQHWDWVFYWEPRHTPLIGLRLLTIGVMEHLETSSSITFSYSRLWGRLTVTEPVPYGSSTMIWRPSAKISKAVWYVSSWRTRLCERLPMVPSLNLKMEHVALFIRFSVGTCRKQFWVSLCVRFLHWHCIIQNFPACEWKGSQNEV